MIIRLVKMEFKQEKVSEFLDIFTNTKDKIRASKGCIDLQLVREATEGNIFFTISKWQSESALNNYRNTILFQDTWKATKKLFQNKAEAWSTREWKQNI